MVADECHIQISFVKIICFQKCVCLYFSKKIVYMQNLNSDNEKKYFVFSVVLYCGIVKSEHGVVLGLYVMSGTP